jgi:hypothetical protein
MNRPQVVDFPSDRLVYFPSGVRSTARIGWSGVSWLVCRCRGPRTNVAQRDGGDRSRAARLAYPFVRRAVTDGHGRTTATALTTVAIFRIPSFLPQYAHRIHAAGLAGGDPARQQHHADHQ